jgi:CHAD domain-containing protein
MGKQSSAAHESVFVVRGEVSPDSITRSLQAILPTRHRSIARHRFTVLDTFDGRVRRAGARLTRDSVNGGSAVVWQPDGGGSQVEFRLNQPVSFAWDLPDCPLKQALAPVIGVRRLFEQADAEEYGSLLEVLDTRDKTVARLLIQSGRVRVPKARNAWRPLPTLVTLTGLRGYKDVYEQLVPVIESRPGVESCPEGVVGLMLRHVGAAQRGDMSPRVKLAPAVSAHAGACEIHQALLCVLLANEPGLRANLDTEFLHDFRVAVRRTRALLGQIKRVFPPADVEHFSSEFAWVGRLTGPPRDMDVLVLELRENRPDVSSGDLEVITAVLDQEQQQSHRELIEALDSERYRKLILDWSAFLKRPASPGPETPNAEHFLADVVSKRAWRLSRRIAASAVSVDEHTPATQLHELRITAKKLRYLVDVTPGFYDPADFEQIVGALKRLQRVLGDSNDAYAQTERLLKCGMAVGAAGGHASALLGLGRLAEQSRQRGERLREQVLDGLAQFCARDTRNACRRTFKRAADRTQ